jgi:S1-C subfamily serine protease
MRSFLRKGGLLRRPKGGPLHRLAFPRLLSLAAVLLAAGAVIAAAQPGNEKKSSESERGAPVAEQGVLVGAVQPGSPADKAGIVRGDIILEAAGRPVNAPEELKTVVDAQKPGDTVALRVRHGDATRTVKVALAGDDGRAFLGVMPVPSFAGRGPGPRAPSQEDRPGPRQGEPFEWNWGWDWQWGGGARVAGVTPAGPAAQAGLAKDDVILSVDGKRVRGGDSLAELIAEHKPGDTVTLSVQSPGGEARDVKVTLGRKADTDGAFLGVEYTAAGPRLPPGIPWHRAPWGSPRDGGIGVVNGVLVAAVSEDSPAEKAGLKLNDLITAVDGVRVRSPQAVAETVASRAPGSRATLTVVRMPDTKEMTIEVVLGENPSEKGKGYLGIRMSRFMGLQGPERPDSDSGPTPWRGPRGPGMRQPDVPQPDVPPGI